MVAAYGGMVEPAQFRRRPVPLFTKAVSSVSPVVVPVAAVVIAKNEAVNIRRCLDSLTWCAERVVIDDHSSDGTAELAASCGARVVTHPFTSFAAQRNWALEQAGVTSEWVLMLDADEVATDAFAQAVAHAVSTAEPDVAGYCLCRKTMLLGKWLKYSDAFPVWIMRLVRRGRASFQDSGHGEVPVPPAAGRLPCLAEPFLHFPFSKGLDDWYDRHNRYSTREALREMEELNPLRWDQLWRGTAAERRRTLRDLARRMPCRSALRFAYHYLWRWGVLEGRAGLTFSTLMATYEGMIVLKRRELEAQRRGTAL